MRQAQNAKRARGRSRKVINQLSRTMDSSGPDVKIRGTASHIYEKYQALARDANSSGDRIMAENYLQHAEHYLRLINTLQGATGREAQPGMNGARGDAADEDQPVATPAPPAQQPPSQPQPEAAAPVPAAASTPTRGRRQRRSNGAAAQSAVPASNDGEAPELPLVDQDAAQAARA